MSLEFLKDSGIKLISCTEKAQKTIYNADYTTPTGIIMGSEENGISTEFLKISNEKVKIPISDNLDSLNVSVATGIILYEAIKQRNESWIFYLKKLRTLWVGLKVGLIRECFDQEGLDDIKTEIFKIQDKEID